MSYRDNLSELDAMRLDAIARRDRALLANVLVRAVAFARFTVQCPTDRAETSYSEWCRTGRWSDDYLRADRTRAISDVRQWAITAPLDVLSADGYTLARDIVANVYGIGLAKGAFAAALVGNPDPACLDVHGMRRAVAIGAVPSVGARDVLFRAKRAAAWSDYRRIAAATFPNGRNDQWAYFASAVPTFAASGHSVYFESIGIGR